LPDIVAPVEKLDHSRLISLGYASLTQQQADQLLRSVYSTMEAMVGMRLSTQLSPSQIDEFGALVDEEDEDGSLAWLQTNIPGYQKVVEEIWDEVSAILLATARQLDEAVDSRPAAE